MLNISDKIKQLPKKDLLKWIAQREKVEKSDDWKEQLAKLKESVSRTGKKSKED